jgi:nucleoside-diphosphate kinase
LPEQNHPEQTLLMVKPDAVRARRVGAIIRRIEEAGFDITGIVMRRLTAADAGSFYSIHRERDFFAGLVEFMTSGPVVALRLSGTGVRRRLRGFVGATDPARAEPGTIRADFGTSVRQNAVHASNPDEDVAKELMTFFPDSIQP